MSQVFANGGYAARLSKLRGRKRLVDLGWRRGPKCRRTSPFSGTSLAKQWWQPPVA